MEWPKHPAPELDFTAAVTSQDARNHHAWPQRQWVIQELNFGIMSCSSNRLDQRSCIISNTTGCSDRVLYWRQRCSECTLGTIKLVPENESAWSHLKGILQTGGFAKYPSLLKKLLDVRPSHSHPDLTGCLVDIHEDMLES